MNAQEEHGIRNWGFGLVILCVMHGIIPDPKLFLLCLVETLQCNASTYSIISRNSAVQKHSIDADPV